MSGRSSNVVRLKRDDRPKPSTARRAWPGVLSLLLLAVGVVCAALVCVFAFIEGIESTPILVAAAACAVLILAGVFSLSYLRRTAVPRTYRSMQGRLMQEIATDLFIRIDVIGNRAVVSESMAREFGLPGKRFGDALEQLCARVHSGDRRRFKRKLIECVNGNSEGQYIDEFRMLCAKNRSRTLLVRGKLESDVKGRPAWFVAIAEDVTSLRKKQGSAQPAVNLDDLTGLPNRRCFEDDLAFDLLGEGLCGVLLAGLDGFKHVNNVYGYDVGDTLLQSVAGRITAVLGGTGLAYRYAGDVFAVIFTGRGENEMKIRDTVCDVFRRAWNIKGQEIYLSASVGSACAPRDGKSVQEILHTAERGLFKEKQYGKHCHIMYNVLHDSPAGERRMMIENGMRRAIENGFKGFKIFYQPIVSFELGRIAGAEALLRFDVEGIGEVEPAEFIPLAECAGLIVPLGQWVLENACGQCRAWHRAGHVGLFVSVNVSVMQMLNGDMVEHVRRALKDSGLPPNRLVLEITENMFIQDMEKVVPQLARLRKLGIRISLDDFGKGYSSLTHLKDIPLDEVKIDRDFIQGLGKKAYYETFIRTIVTLAHTINLSVTSEGIETPAQRKKVMALGSDNGQGFFMSPAIEPEYLPALL